ncbi:NAD(P)/FAD-dependent oxidoreductase [Methanocella arvoryzae]|uniref:NAD(P)/FAD-dependent oxidoreductase n=1 Tax=Methanocella arvoryzae TaxID=1175445 RepID=UPI001E289455|nr:FAD-dependent oxidoreductase [Methanocella arvoryzae]
MIGAGPAGLTAALYAKRKGLTLAVIADSIGGQMSKTANIENYPGHEIIPGKQLALIMQEQIKQLGQDIVMDRVTGVERIGNRFRTTTATGKHFDSRTLIIATGAHWREIGVPGEKEFKNRGVSYCTTCDGPLFADMDVAVVGGANAAAESVLEMTHYATKVYMIVRSTLKADQILADRIMSSPKVTVLQGYTVEKITGTDFVEAIHIRSKAGEQKTLQVGGVFVEIGQDPNTDFLKGLVKTNDKGEIIIDEYCRTSVQGIYACGDVTDVPQKQVIVAAGEGAKAAMDVYTYLSTHR